MMKPRKKAEIVQITKVRMPRELKDKLLRSAARNNRTQNGELVARLEASFAKDEETLNANRVLNAVLASSDTSEKWREVVATLWEQKTAAERFAIDDDRERNNTGEDD
jgi:hypothetical protein